MRGKLKLGVRRFPWPLLLAVTSSVACGSPPPPSTASTLPPPKAAPAKSTAKPTPGTQSLELVTAHVTAADVAIAPNAKWLAFNALGHLYRLSAKGGDAEQLTFGPYYDREPAVSPDGRRIVFVSNRGSASLASLFLLNLSTGEIAEIKGAIHASQPSWSPDGKSLSFLSRPPAGKAEARRVDLGANRIYTRSGSGLIEAVAFLNDGRLAWAERDPAGTTSQILALAIGGQATTELNVKGAVLGIVPDPKNDSLFLTLHHVPTGGPPDPDPASIVSVRLPGGEPTAVTNIENAVPNARFSALEGQLWLCERGTLLQADARTGKKQPLRLSLEASLEVFPRTTPHWAMPAAHPAAVLDPRVIAKNGGVLFSAAGYLWQLPPGASQPKRVFNESEGYEWGPAAPSPDGTRVAVQVSLGATQELRIADLKGGANVRTIASSDRTINFQPAWHPNGTQLAYVAVSEGAPVVHVVELKTGKRSKLATDGTWQPTPHFSGDGAWLYFTAKGQVQRVALDGKSQPETITNFSSPFDRALVGPNAKSIAVARGESIWWVTSPGSPDAKFTDAGAVPASDVGGRGFGLVPGGGTELIYANGAQILQQIPTDLRTLASVELPKPATEPLLVRNARLLDFERGRFKDPVSIYIDAGRIQWIGPESEHKVSLSTRVLDAAGRFAIPGLVDLGTHLAARDAGGSGSAMDRLDAFIAFGVTTVLDVGGDPELIQTWSDRRQALGGAVPRILSHPAVIKTLTYSSSGELQLSEAELRHRVAAAKAAGAHGIAAAPELPWALQRVLADEAAKQGLVVSGLAPERDQVLMGALLGYWSVPGLSGATPPADDLVQLLAKTRTHLVTTLSSPWGNPILSAEEPSRRGEPRVVAFTFTGGVRQDWARGLAPALRKQAYDRTVGGFQLAQHGDVPIAVGSGAPDAECFYGHCLHTELWHLAHAGLTPLQILRQATLGNAAALGAAEHFGALEPGKLADLVLLDKDPLADIHNAMSIAYVVSEGRPFKDGKPVTVTPAPPPAATPPAPKPTPATPKKP